MVHSMHVKFLLQLNTTVSVVNVQLYNVHVASVLILHIMSSSLANCSHCLDLLLLLVLANSAACWCVCVCVCVCDGVG